MAKEYTYFASWRGYDREQNRIEGCEIVMFEYAPPMLIVLEEARKYTEGRKIVEDFFIYDVIERIRDLPDESTTK